MRAAASEVPDPASSGQKNTQTSSKVLGPCTQPRRARALDLWVPVHTSQEGMGREPLSLCSQGCGQAVLGPRGQERALVWFHG